MRETPEEIRQKIADANYIPRRDMSNKRTFARNRRKHQWTVIFVYDLSEEEAEHLTFGPAKDEKDVKVTLNSKNTRTTSSVSCWKCEQSYGMAHELPCPGSGKLREANGTGA